MNVGLTVLRLHLHECYLLLSSGSASVADKAELFFGFSIPNGFFFAGALLGLFKDAKWSASSSS